MGIVVDPSLAVENCGVGILLKNLATLFEIISRSGQVGQCNGSNIEYVDRVKVVNLTGQIMRRLCKNKPLGELCSNLSVS